MTHQMPDTITHDGEAFFLTRYRRTTLAAAPVDAPVGTEVFEYWHSDRGDNVRIYAVSPNLYWIS